MEIKTLKTFIRTAEYLSFTRAAEALGYTQAAVSFQIKQLEKELGCSLFDRINHSIALTDKGEELLVYAKEVTRMTDSFLDSSTPEEAPAGKVNIITSDSICEEVITHSYLDFHKKYPDIALRFSTANTDEMLEALRNNSTDVIFTLDRHTYDSNFIIVKEEPVKVHFTAGADFPLAGKKHIKIQELLQYPFYLTESGMAYRRILDEKLASMSLEVEPVIELGRPDIIGRCLEMSNGVSFLPEFTTINKVKEGKLVYLDVDDFDLIIWKQLIHHKNKWISRAMKAFLDYIQANEFGR